MASRMRYRNTKPRPKDLRDVTPPRDRSPKHPGDAPVVLGQPPKVRWSIGTYPYADHDLDQDPS